MLIKIAARKSDLARLQAYEVGRSLSAAHPHLKIEYYFSTSLGDQNQTDPLWKMPEKGVFTADLSEKLKLGDCDVVVHSFKDLPTEWPAPVVTEIIATLPRADVRDVLLLKSSRVKAASHDSLRIYTSSPRRAYNLSEFFKWALPIKADVEFHSVRGNMATRFQKLMSDDIDGLVVAKAAVDRLMATTESEFAESREVIANALVACHWMVLPLTSNPAAPAQGALAIEVLSDREDLRSLFSKINCEKTLREVNHEREVFKAYGGGCHQKIGLTSVEKFYGRIDFGRGQPINGEAFSFVRLEAAPPRNTQEKVSANQVFPLQMQDSQFFTRKKRVLAPKELDGHDLWVARADAWPEGYAPTKNQIIWSSGLDTWKKLAAQNIWVNGSNEGLGERNINELKFLMRREPSFVKLTHLEATRLEAETQPPMKSLAGYELVASDRSVDLSGKTHFFWASFSLFRWALQLAPSIIDGYHACGPGLSYELIRKELERLRPNERARLDIFISRESWLESTVKK